MTEINSAPEYAIEVPGRGFAVGTGWPNFALGDEPLYTPSLDDVTSEMARLQSHYIGLGCPEVAETIRIVSRTVTVTRGDWAPYAPEEAL